MIVVSARIPEFDSCPDISIAIVVFARAKTPEPDVTGLKAS
jgi:hypothetical protein